MQLVKSRGAARKQEARNAKLQADTKDALQGGQEKGPASQKGGGGPPAGAA